MPATLPRPFALVATAMVAFALSAQAAYAAPPKKGGPKVSEGKAGVAVSSMTKGAKVFIDDKEVGEVPLPGIVEVEPTRHTVQVKKRGYTTFIDTILPSPGQVVEVEADLVPSGGFLKVKSAKTDLKLQLLIDGNVVGTTPFDGDVAPGKHVLEARAAGYLPESRPIDVVAGQELSLAFELKLVPAPIVKEDKSLLSRWWFWTAVGAAVVGGVATTVALSQDTHVQPKPAGYVLVLGN
ncbi:MAG: PEGA domain-containing protein [Deltaproteobacteria bacterium]|nr:PEGA domain-containing protein [Deltaproteobacteria bacterium]